ncbi:MAG: LuxR C-terminal-related transcriptional regulator [Candidatus Limisoma sp.]
MDNSGSYKSGDKLRDVISTNSSILMVMSRFGIALGFGEKTVGEICEEQGVDCGTFLAVSNFCSGNYVDEHSINLPSLIDYLKRAHTYFLDYNLPTIRRRIIEAIDCSGNDEVALLILQFYDNYVGEVRKHMAYEDKRVFAYVGSLLQGKYNKEYTIRTFADKHNSISVKLKELKDIIIRYYPGKNNDALNSVLFDIINCELDLNMHCRVEDCLFVPAVERLEEEVAKTGCAECDAVTVDADVDKPETLSRREKEIIACVAKGLSNKEIADQLFLSVHTVTTHRRNICSKLQIHSPAGLTIYAIINKIVRIDDIKMV